MNNHPSDGEDRTVADDDPEYNEDDPVAVVAFVESGLNNEWAEWTGVDPGDLYESARANDVPCYHFLASRLKVLDENQVAEFMAPEPTVA